MSFESLSPALAPLHNLARAWGLEPDFHDGLGRPRRTSPETLCAVLAVLGAPVERPADAPEALARRRAEASAPRVDVTWGARRPGYRRHADDGRLEILAPERAAPHPDPGWGVFLPLYALAPESLHDDPTAVASLTDLHRFAVWAGSLGAARVGVLPLLAGFLEGGLDPFDPSPYSPASRRFWNELYVDPAALASACGLSVPEARGGPPETGEDGRLLDTAAAMARRRRDLEAVARAFAAQAGDAARERLRAFRRERPEVEDYAAFRAHGEALGTPWSRWPATARDGVLRPGDVDPERFRYHLLCQWAAEEQLAALRRDPRAAGLYLDLPLGSHGSSYDVWRDRDLYGLGLSVGAPPDAFFANGQDWGFPPLLPEPLAAAGLRPWIETVRHALRSADTLRIDHVMQLERLYVIPHGGRADDGVYLRYPMEALAAVLVTESHRLGTPVVGEDLGTVSPAIRSLLDDRSLARSYVALFEFTDGAEASPLRPVPAGAMASVATHDTPTFHGFWEGRDLDLRRELDLFVDPADLATEASGRKALRRRLGDWVDVPGGDPPADGTAGRVLDRVHETLAASPASLVMVQVEDLLGETEPQNVPGTGPERPNWRRRTRRPFEDWSTDPALLERLARVDRSRRSS